MHHSFAVHSMQQGAGDIYTLSHLLSHEHLHASEHYLWAFQARGAAASTCSTGLGT